MFAPTFKAACAFEQSKTEAQMPSLLGIPTLLGWQHRYLQTATVMQFHLNGFRPGDPAITPAACVPQTDRLPACVDVLIVGSGSAGLTLAAQLSAFPDVTTRLIEAKSGPMEKGQADGVSCRSMEMFEAFGFAHTVMREAYWVNETTFWKTDPNDADSIVRTGRIQDVEDGLSEMPHVILNQARVHDMYLDFMRLSAHRLAPDYDRRLDRLDVAETGTHPVTATIIHSPADAAPTEEMVRARYVVGCDGARSTVRGAMGLELKGDSANKAWGVMDVLVVTDFPDIRQKTLVQAAGSGALLIIPREGGYMARIYVELETLGDGERARDRNITLDQLIVATQRIFRPYSFEVKNTIWWSVYEIGQRMTDRFDNAGDAPNGPLPSVFIAGDACHTHSPKAGQGMNVSMGDSFNLGWKLAAVLQGRAAPELLCSYSTERAAVARQLIIFDQEWARVLAAQSSGAGNTPKFQEYFVEHGRYTAGVSVRYEPSQLIGKPKYQHLAAGFDIGMRLHSAPVIRLADAKPMHIGHTLRADGRWRLFLFADAAHPTTSGSRLAQFCRYLYDNPASLLRSHRPAGEDIDAVIDVRGIVQSDFRSMDLGDLPILLRPPKGRFGLIDSEKAFCPDLKNDTDIFDLRGIDRCNGCIVIVRPDQYVAHILPLDGFLELSAFFRNILTS